MNVQVVLGSVCICVMGSLAAEAGTIRGRVYDPSTGQSLVANGIAVRVPYGKGPLRLDSELLKQYWGARESDITVEHMEISRRRLSPDGTFEFSNLAPGEKLVIVYPPSGYAFAYASIVLTHENDLQYVDFPLEKGAKVGGTVVDAAGAPVAGARVAVVYTDPEIQGFWIAGGHPSKEVQTTEDGRFAFEGNIKPRVSILLEASGEEWLPVHSQEFTLQPGEQRDGIVLKLWQKGVRLVVIVEDEQGRPVANAPVMMRDYPLVRPKNKKLMLAPSEQIPISGFTDEQGRIVFPGLAPGLWEISATDPPRARRVRKEIELPPSGAVKELHVTVRPQ